jgi:hypothetical protein
MATLSEGASALARLFPRLLLFLVHPRATVRAFGQLQGFFPSTIVFIAIVVHLIVEASLPRHDLRSLEGELTEQELASAEEYFAPPSMSKMIRALSPLPPLQLPIFRADLYPWAGGSCGFNYLLPSSILVPYNRPQVALVQVGCVTYMLHDFIPARHGLPTHMVTLVSFFLVAFLCLLAASKMMGHRIGIHLVYATTSYWYGSSLLLLTVASLSPCWSSRCLIRRISGWR